MASGGRCSVAVVGGGFSGIGLAIGLRRAGFTDITIFEKAGSIGGVWRDNTYPGAACDAPVYLYSYSFAPNPDWSRRFAEQPEILTYLRRCADAYGITERVRFGTEVTEAAFDEAAGAWTIRTSDGGTHTADLLVAACGQLSRPAYPDIPGLDAFAGTVFHSARWDHDHDLTGRNVAVIGNGASAVQFVPVIARAAGRLRIFQRTPNWVGTKPDRVYPAWRRALNRRLPSVQKASRFGIFASFEWLLNPMLVAPLARRALSAHVRALCHLNLRSVRDPRLRTRLLPSYELGCKRILLSNDYYRALNRPNVEVVTDAITKVTADTVVTADGTAHPADTVILATGFRSHDFVAPMRITGLGGRELAEAWRDGPSAYLGLSVPGFPNFFLMYGPNTNLGSGSILHMLESQIAHIVQAAGLIRRGVRYLDVKREVVDAFDARVRRRLGTSVWNAGGCDSWYLRRSADGTRRNTNNWPGFMLGYRRRTRRVTPSDYRLVSR
jgi:cation diffusion facilitator CzcD-associated flavoprotein CzcO